MIGTGRSAVACAAGIALLTQLALACGRYGPPVRPVPAADPQADSERFDGPDDAYNAESRADAVPYLLEGLIDEQPPAEEESAAEDPGEKDPDGEGK